jgi:hypothetical protein
MRKPFPPPGIASGSDEPSRHDARASATSASADPASAGRGTPNRTRELDEDRTAEIDPVVDTEPNVDASDAASHESLVWPPPDEELNGWEIVQFESTGRTLIEPMRPMDEAARGTPTATPASASRGPDTPPPAPRLYSTIPTPPAALALPSDEGLSIDRSLRVERSSGPSLAPYARDPQSAHETAARDRQPPHAVLAHGPDENLPETQVIEPLLHAELSGHASGKHATHAPPAIPDPLAPTPARPMAASSRPQATPPPVRGSEAGPTAVRPGAQRPAPQIIVQGGAHPPAGADVPTEARLSARDQTHPRLTPAPGRPGTQVSVPHAGGDAHVDPSAQTRIMPLPVGLGRARVPASMIDTLRDDDRANPQGSAASHDPFATNVWPSPPLVAPHHGSAPPAGSGPHASWTEPTRTYTRSALDDVPQPVLAADSFDQSGIVANRRTGLPLWRIALIVIALVAIAEVAYLVVRTLRPSAGTSLTPAAGDTTSGTATGDAPTANTAATPAAPSSAPASAPTSAAPAPAATASAPTTAALEVRSDPSGARVSIDGVERGRTPLIVSGLAPGRRQVRVSGPFPTIVRHITLSAGQQGSINVAPRLPETDRSSAAPNTNNSGAAAQVGAAEGAARPAPVGRGWLTIDSPLVLRVVRNGDFLGTSEDARIPLPAGTHEIGLENESVNFREMRRVDVPVNRGVAVAVALPQGMLNINAVPWADVFVDGQSIGQTPVSQLALPIGPHEILYRHPQHGDRRITVIVKVGTPGRSFVDFTK